MKNSRTLAWTVMFIIVLAFSVAMTGCGADSLDKEAGDLVLIEEVAEAGDSDGSSEGLDVPDDSNEPIHSESDASKKPSEDTHLQDESVKLSCTFSINCATIFDNSDKIDAAVLSLQPTNGWIFSPSAEDFKEGESVFDILLRLTQREKIHMEFNANPALNSKYIEGINNLYEFDAGELSGWTYKVNGQGMGYGSSGSYPKDGDIIEWLYTCDQGRDLGFEP